VIASLSLYLAAGLNAALGPGGSVHRPAHVAQDAAGWASLAFAGLVLGGIVWFGLVLYRRSKAEREPHLDLLEEMAEWDEEEVLKENAYEM
jgi:hypothetical protein